MTDYPVSELFHSIQGEGHFAGYPMTFVRLAGCSVLGCHIRAECDEAPWKAQRRMSTAEIIEACGVKGRRGIVCITGGEPTDHELAPLIVALHDARFRVHLETSGARAVTGLPIEWLTVSPKLLSGGQIRQRMGHALKLIVRPEWDDEQAWGIAKSIADATAFFHYYMQPLTLPGGSADMGQVIRLLLSEHNGGGKWALSTQQHRQWGVR